MVNGYDALNLLIICYLSFIQTQHKQPIYMIACSAFHFLFLLITGATERYFFSHVYRFLCNSMAKGERISDIGGEKIKQRGSEDPLLVSIKGGEKIQLKGS